MREDREIEQVMTMMDSLVEADSAEIQSSPHAALRRFKQSAFPSQPVRSKSIMNTQRNTILGAVIALALLVSVATIPATRAWASDMLSVFRVAKFAPISVSPQQLAMLEEIMDSGEEFYPGDIEFSEEPEPGREVNTLSEAADYQAELLGYDAGIRTLDGFGEPSIYVQPGGEATLTINLESARNLLAAANIDPQLLPDALDAQQVTALASPSVMQEFDSVYLMQMVAPVINYPDGVNPQPIGKALLMLLGMDEGEATRVSSSIDWTSTLLMPIPSEFATFSEVSVDGGAGLAIMAADGTGENMLMWQAGGHVYMLSAENADTDDLLDIAMGLYYYWD